VIREFPNQVTTGSAEGVAQRIAERMRDARERRAASRGAVGAQPAGDQRVAELERLGQLRDSGVLSTDEFDAEKKRILETT
jgi:hypothetical protein